MDREMYLNGKANFFLNFYLQSKKATITKEKATINNTRYTYLLCIFLREQRGKLQVPNIT